MVIKSVHVKKEYAALSPENHDSESLKLKSNKNAIKMWCFRGNCKTLQPS